MAFYVYILASKRNGTLYVGMADDVVKRVWQHKNGVIAGFTRSYGVKTLVWYEAHDSREVGIHPGAPVQTMESNLETRVD